MDALQPRGWGCSLNIRRTLVFCHDAAAAAVAWMIAFWLRFNFDVPHDYEALMTTRLPLVIAIHGLVFWMLRLYRGLWRYASLPDLQRILIAVGISALAVPSAITILQVGIPVPRSVYVLAPLVLVLLMGASRIAYRSWREGHFLLAIFKPRATPVLILGGGAAAASLLKDLAGNPRWRAVGILDDDFRKRDGELLGVKIFGELAAVDQIARRLGVEQAVIAMPGATHGERKRALDLCNKAGISAMTVPALSDIVSGKVSVSALRAIELDDLLGRDPVQLDSVGLHDFISGRTVLVTGAGGSIGAELCRQIARFSPSQIVLFELSEFALYTIEQEFRDQYPRIAVRAVIGDAKDSNRVAEVFTRYAPQVVFHAAAYKHVPLMEEENAWQAVINNVLSTLIVARAAEAHGTQNFILVSTDKAVNPSNIMGASKRLAEMVCQELQQNGRTKFMVVRFGNVLGSTGSVVPRFRDQIARGGPVTVTDKDMQRYFMSIPEAAQLVLQAALMGKGGEIFVLDMGEAVKIVDLAKQLIRLSGLTERDIAIEFTGLRPGEKLYEEPLAELEKTLLTPHPKLRIARARSSGQPDLVGSISAWIAGNAQFDAVSLRAKLQVWIPEYAPAASLASATPEIAPLAHAAGGHSNNQRVVRIQKGG
jgi:FlaA1/EpsC-like NDP-sugar epimerase